LSAKNGKIGGFAGARESAQVAGKFFTTAYSGAGTTSFHAGDDSHQLGLSGVNGLLNLVDLVNPTADTIPKDVPTEWSVFEVGSGGQLGVKDGSTIPSRTWVIYLETDGAYYVGLWDGEFLCCQPAKQDTNISRGYQATADCGECDSDCGKGASPKVRLDRKRYARHRLSRAAFVGGELEVVRLPWPRTLQILSS
jgi:hypothetical protein